jgi:hypothetical protein
MLLWRNNALENIACQADFSIDSEKRESIMVSFDSLAECPTCEAFFIIPEQEAIRAAEMRDMDIWEILPVLCTTCSEVSLKDVS